MTTVILLPSIHRFMFLPFLYLTNHVLLFYFIQLHLSNLLIMPCKAHCGFHLWKVLCKYISSSSSSRSICSLYLFCLVQGQMGCWSLSQLQAPPSLPVHFRPSQYTITNERMKHVCLDCERNPECPCGFAHAQEEHASFTQTRLL